MAELELRVEKIKSLIVQKSEIIENEREMDTNNKKLCLIFDFTVHFAQILTTSGQLLVLVVAVAATASRPPFCSKAAPFSELFFPKVGRPTAWRRTSRVTMERMERRLMPLTRCTELAEVQSRLRLII